MKDIIPTHPTCLKTKNVLLNMQRVNPFVPNASFLYLPASREKEHALVTNGLKKLKNKKKKSKRKVQNVRQEPKKKKFHLSLPLLFSL